MVLAQQWYGENTGSGETRGFQWLELVAGKLARQVLRGRETGNGLLLPDRTLPMSIFGERIISLPACWTDTPDLLCIGTSEAP